MRPDLQLGLYLSLSTATVIFVSYTVHATWHDNLKGNRAVFITDYIKVLVQFLQYIMIIGSVFVPWPLFDVQRWLGLFGILVTMGAGQALSLDCWLYSYFPNSKLPITIQRILVHSGARVYLGLCRGGASFIVGVAAMGSASVAEAERERTRAAALPRISDAYYDTGTP